MSIWKRKLGRGISLLVEGELCTLDILPRAYIGCTRQASADAPTATELLELAAEQDGTLEADDKTEQKRIKDENWARYTEANPKGAGNTMNRG